LNADSSRPSAASKTYTRNVKGRTYGTLSEVAASGEWPDLIKVIASNGKVGYVKTEEFMPLRKEISDSDLKAFLASTATVWDQDERAPVGEYRQRAGGRRAERATRVVQRRSADPRRSWRNPPHQVEDPELSTVGPARAQPPKAWMSTPIEHGPHRPPATRNGDCQPP